MSSSTAKWREEQILVICPGSRTTMAQLGCAELTPPARRLPTRMFREGARWRPYYTFRRGRVVDGVEREEWVEDVDEGGGAVWPMQGGRIVHMDAFLAFLEHVHGLLTTTYHNTPIMLMASPQWTRPDCEAIAQYTFEKTRTPALCMIHSGIATQYGLKWPNMTVVDIGYEKVDVTAIHDGRVVNQTDLGAGASGGERRISGGEVFTQRLKKLLEGKGFTHDMAEQLKRSAICEVLSYAAGEKDLVELPEETATEATKLAEPGRPAELGSGEAETGGEAGPVAAADDGVLDVAAIVTSGQTKEFLAKKEEEREKEKKKPGRKPKGQQEAEAAAAAAAAKPVRLPNSKRRVGTFYYEEVIQELVVPEPERKQDDEGVGNGGVGDAPMADESAAAGPSSTAGDAALKQPKDRAPGGQAAGEAASAPAPAPAAPAPAPAPAPTDGSAPAPAPPPEYRPRRVRRDMEIGLERFTFASRDEIDRIVTAIYRTIQGIDNMYMRPPCWDNLVFVGNGSRLRGLKENILQTLHARHLVSPSTATMFTSELPSNVATPTGTGSQTPTGSFTGAPPHQLPASASASGVNPLLQAATTASTLGAGAAGPSAAAAPTPAAGSSEAAAGAGPTTHHFHSQTPTSIKTAALPTYLSEWTKSGFEEAMFLGAQVAARIAFCLHSNLDAQGVEAQRLMSLSRVDYNELGPKAIRTHSMLE